MFGLAHIKNCWTQTSILRHLCFILDSSTCMILFSNSVPPLPHINLWASENPKDISHQLLSWQIILYMYCWYSEFPRRTRKLLISTHHSILLIIVTVMILLPTFSVPIYLLPFSYTQPWAVYLIICLCPHPCKLYVFSLIFYCGKYT